MRRIHLFELHEQHWVPALVRDSVVESLHCFLRHRRLADGMIDPLREFLRRSGGTRVLDLCSGAGGPALLLAEELRRQEEEEPPQVILTDLFPRTEVWKAAREKLSVNVDYWPHSVDATRVDRRLSTGCVRMINNAFHHFPPDAARAILEDAVNHSGGIFISELFPRGLNHFLHFALTDPWIVPALPVLTSRHRFLKAFFTLAVPIIPIATFWDGLVSALRMYTEDELRRMVAPFGGRFDWVYGTCRYRSAGTATYFYGVPRDSSGPSE